MTAIAVVAGAGSGLIGVLLSTRYDVAAGGTITVVTGTAFALSLTVTTAWNALAARHRHDRRSTAGESYPVTTV
jgi:ABC-type Mn2+/Zn2+ transport system permease subunit